MDFELTDDQVALQEGIRAFLDGRFSLDDVRAIEARRPSTATAGSELGETGVFSIALPEADGGLELGVSEAALVFEELGRALVPGPLVATLLAAAWIDGAATGETIVGRFEPGDAGVGARASRPTSTRCSRSTPTACAAVDPDAIATDAGRAPARPAHAARDRRRCLPAGELIADAATRPRDAGSSARAHRARCSSGSRCARPSSRRRTPRSASSSTADRLVPGGEAPVRRHARARRGARAPRCTRPRCALDGRSDDDPGRAAAAAQGPRRRRRASPTARRASRCTAASGSRGRSTCTSTGSAPWVLDTHFGNSDEHAEAVAAML